MTDQMPDLDPGPVPPEPPPSEDLVDCVEVRVRITRPQYLAMRRRARVDGCTLSELLRRLLSLMSVERW